VYITEAHPTDVWQMQSNIKEQVVFASPKDEEERASIAGACVRKLNLKFPAVLDEFGNSTERAYTGWPDRMYLIDSLGKIRYKSKPGPFGFKSEELAAALARVAPKQANRTASN
jgi:Iodothyronine deiodinase